MYIGWKSGNTTLGSNNCSSRQSAYACSLLAPARKRRQLRSSCYGIFFIPKVKTNVGTRAAQTLWNSLVVSVKYAGNVITFRHNLKTHIFVFLSSSFNCW